jgi:hypothetical protein
MKFMLNQMNPSRVQTAAAGITLSALMLLSGPAHADPRGWDRHAAYAHHGWHHRGYGPGPGVVYAPPVVYEPPPQPVVESEPGINLIVPLHIR